MPEENKSVADQIREIVRQELDKTTFDVPTHTHEKKPEKKEDEKVTEETCDVCGTKVKKNSKFCRGCGEELDWPET